ncbi:MAG: hypothetical protein KatS3mg115_2593 [Candidatus Poribacteria bacterium]|nr:MAG: hypothetical protein KatS3mg115_2593 [Candidatus Poribacteria bacterium]
MSDLRAPERQALRRQMRDFYRRAATYKQQLQTHTEAYQSSYVALVERFVPRGGLLLELGSGLGIAARMLSERGYRVVGIDVSPLFLKEAAAWRSERLDYLVGDGLELPFVDEAFDAVVSHQYLEHVPDVELALNEMGRVLRPGGRVVLVGPNLLSPLVPLMEWRNTRRGRVRRAVWARHLGGALVQARDNWRLLRQKRKTDRPQFSYRRPELDEEVSGGDADSVYLANPTDLGHYFRGRGWRILARGAGVSWRGRLLAVLAPELSPYLCFVAERPAGG